MKASTYLRSLIDEAFKMLENEALTLSIPVTTERKIMPYDLYSCNATMIIKGIMQVVLFEKNFNALKGYYPALQYSEKKDEEMPEFDDFDIKYLVIKGGNFPTPVQAPTLSSKYGDIIIGLPDSFVAAFYAQLSAVVTTPANDDNVVKVDFNGKKPK